MTNLSIEQILSNSSESELGIPERVLGPGLELANALPHFVLQLGMQNESVSGSVKAKTPLPPPPPMDYLGFSSWFYPPECHPPRFLGCRDLSIFSFLFWAEHMWPKSQGGYELREFSDPGSNWTSLHAIYSGNIATEVAWYPIAISPYYDYSQPIAMAKTYAYHSVHKVKLSFWARLLHGLSSNFASLDGVVWLAFAVCSVSLHFAGALLNLKHPAGHRFHLALLLGVNAANLVKFYRVNLSAATLVPLPPRPLFENADELAGLVASGKYKILVYSKQSGFFNDIQNNPALAKLKAALVDYPPEEHQSGYGPICRFLIHHPNFVLIDDGQDMDFACQLSCLVKSDALASAFSAKPAGFLFRKHYEQLERANAFIPAVRSFLEVQSRGFQYKFPVEDAPFCFQYKKRTEAPLGGFCELSDEHTNRYTMRPDMCIGALIILGTGLAISGLVLLAERLLMRRFTQSLSPDSPWLYCHSALGIRFHVNTFFFDST